MTPQLAPQKIITLSAVLLACIISLTAYLATSQAWLGLTLGVAPEGDSLIVLRVDAQSPAAEHVQAGDRLHALGEKNLQLQPADIMEEPDELTSYRDYNAFLKRQGELYAALSRPLLTLRLDNNRTVQLTPLLNRPLSSLPLLFWYQLACGAIIFLAGVSVLAFRPRETVTIYYALTGLGLLLAMASAAIYSTRELALPSDLFYQLSLTNQFGTYLFAGPFISILWYYPRQIHRFPLGPVLIGGYFICWLLNLFQVYATLDAGMRYPILAGLAINLGLAVKQWRLSHKQPVQRAILKWFLLAWLSGTTLYVGLHTIPLMLHIDAVIGQSAGWAILLTVYLGIALGITRYRLFNLDRWVITAWFWFLGGLGIIVMDALLVSLLDLSNHLALAITLAVAGWLYFPLRQLIWSRLSGSHRHGLDYRDLFPDLLTIMLNSRQQDLAAEWSQLMQRLFSPLHIEKLDHSPRAVMAHPEGVALTIPGFRDIKGLKLTYADRGNRLFNEEDRRLADAVHQLFRRIQLFREAFDNGVQEERQRVARDLHDDVGAKLLSLVYSAPTEAQEKLARETLQELRAVIRGLEHKHYSLSSTLAELHMETARRCGQRQLTLQWNQPEALHDQTLESRQHSNLQRIVREAITNALRHGCSSRIQVDIEKTGTQLLLQVSNDTNRADQNDSFKPGRGIRNISARAKELGGSTEWHLGEASILGGCTVHITTPLQRGGNNE